MKENKKFLNLYVKDKEITPLYIDGFTETSSKLCNFVLTITGEIGLTIRVNANLSMNLSLPIDFNADFNYKIQSSYDFAFMTSASNCYAADYGNTSEFSRGENSGLMMGAGVGPEGKNVYYYTFLPFEIDFSSITVTNESKPLFIESAFLKFVSQAESPNVVPTELLLFTNEINSTAPTTATGIKGITPLKTVSSLSKSIYNSWRIDNEYYIDVTSLCRQAFGALKYELTAYDYINGGAPTFVITTTKSSEVVIIPNGATFNTIINGIKDALVSADGSSSRNFYSYTSAITANTEPPVLEIVASIYKPYKLSEAIWIQSTNPTITHYEIPMLLIGKKDKDINRALFYFNLAPLKGKTITVSSCKMVLSREFGSTSGILEVYPMLKEPGLIDATWNNRYSNIAWGTAGGQSGVDYSATKMGEVNIATTYTLKETEITLNTTIVQSWVDNPINNMGMMVKMKDDNEFVYWKSTYWPGILTKIYGGDFNEEAAKRPYLILDYVESGTNYRLKIQSDSYTITTL